MKHIEIHLHYDPPPIPTRAFDWQGAVDGCEEWASVAGPTPWACLRELADVLEERGDAICTE